MIEHLPVLVILVPLMAAPLCVILRKRAFVMPLALSVAWSTFAIAAMLLEQVLAEGTIRYAMGGWPAPWGIEYRVDVLAAFVVLFVAGIAAIVLTFAPKSLAAEVPEQKQPLFFTAYLLCASGLMGIAITGDLFNLFVFLEISSLSSYALIALGRRRRALVSSLQYLVMGTIGATFILIGIGLMLMMTGTLNMVDMAVQLEKVGAPRTILVVFAFLTVGIFLKMALFPLHMWLPNAYTDAPSVVTAFLAATATKVSVYIMIRFNFTVFRNGEIFDQVDLSAILMPLALVAIFACSTIAIFQTNVKRLLAYSSLAQIGYMVLGLSFESVPGVTGGIVHMFNHALIKGGLFLAMGCIALRIGSVELKDMRGLGKRMPVTMFLWVIGGLGLIGVPATAGFISKWYFIRAALEGGQWPVAALMLLSSLLAVIYVWRVVEVAYFQPPPPDSEKREAPLSMLIPTCALIAATVFFGLFTHWSADIAREAAETLLGVTP